MRIEATVAPFPPPFHPHCLACCNERRFDRLGEFVDKQMSGSGSADGLAAYVERVKAVCTGFPDYHWELQELVVEENTIAGRLIGQGMHTGFFNGIAPTGRKITIQELVIHRIDPVVRDAVTTPTHVAA